MNIKCREGSILIKYIDSNNNKYKCVISENDLFFINFCRKNIEKMEKILRNGSIVKVDSDIIFRVEEPIFLEYILKKYEKKYENFEEYKILKEENIFYKKKILELEKSLENVFNILKLLNEKSEKNYLNSLRKEEKLRNFYNDISEQKKNDEIIHYLSRL